jgi:hypothetical protein
LTSLPAKKSDLSNDWELTDAGGHRLFLPAAGWRGGYDGSLAAPGLSGYYWSATPFNSSDVQLLVLGYDMYLGYNDRRRGYSVRCVKN